MHLSKTDSTLCERFFVFLDKISNKQTKALYILGDFFEVWVGDDEQTEFQRKVASSLKSLTEQGIKLYIMQGNRDFLLKQGYAKQCGGILLNDPHTIQIKQQTIILTHGDNLCTDDKGYMFYRYIVHLTWLQAIFLKLPLVWRKKIAKKLRENSEKHSQKKPLSRQDVNVASLIKLCHAHKSNFLIHGHTHRPATHQHGDITRIVLAAWHGQGHYLMIDDEFIVSTQYF